MKFLEMKILKQLRFGYNEMLLWVGVNNEQKIRDTCNYIKLDDGEDKPNL